jgi:two-component system, cell cycle sensor histidine kinase and response regulator CckA
MAGDLRAQACLTRSAKPCADLAGATESALHECAPRLFEPTKELENSAEIAAIAGNIAHDFNNLLSIITTFTLLVLEDLKPDDPARPDLEEVCRAAARARELARELWELGHRSPSEARVV